VGFFIFDLPSDIGHLQDCSAFVQALSGGIRKPLDRRALCNHFGYMKTVSYTLRVEAAIFKRVKQEARKRKKSLADIFRDSIAYGLTALPPVPDLNTVIADTWEKLGPAPEIDYDKL
jgi:hypothetical protein